MFSLFCCFLSLYLSFTKTQLLQEDLELSELMKTLSKTNTARAKLAWGMLDHCMNKSLANFIEKIYFKLIGPL